MKEKKETLKSRKESPLFTESVIPKGNGKLLDYIEEKTGGIFRYAQFNTRAILDCPFRSVGCEKVCYATKGNHVFSSVKNSREKAYEESKAQDFAEKITYTINVHFDTARYKKAIMIVRIHESGDFYSLQYLKKWIRIWSSFENDKRIVFVFYTKSFRFFLMLDDDEKALINRMLESGQLAMNLSLDDTTSPEQIEAYLEMKKAFPKANTYYCTEHVDNVEHDNVCDCANCAKCGTCNRGTGKTTVVKIHSASRSDMETYRANIK